MIKYKCSKHGNIGDPNCSECWDILEKMCKDKNAILVYDEEDRPKRITAQFKEICTKCSGYRLINRYENGMIEKVVYSVKDRKCKHKWNFNFKGVMEALRKCTK